MLMIKPDLRFVATLLYTGITWVFLFFVFVFFSTSLIARSYVKPIKSEPGQSQSVTIVSSPGWFYNFIPSLTMTGTQHPPKGSRGRHQPKFRVPVGSGLFCLPGPIRPPSRMALRGQTDQNMPCLCGVTLPFPLRPG